MTDSKTILLAFPLGNSAVSDYFHSLSAELVSRGYEVIILTPGRGKDSQSGNPLIYHWPSIRPTHGQDALFLRKIVKQYKPVMVMANFGAVNICLLTSFLLGVPLRFARYHTAFDQDWKAQNSNKLKIVWQVFRKTLVYKFTTMLLPVAEAMSIELEKIYKVPHRKIKCFHNAIEATSVPSMSGDRLQKKLICAGRLTFGKGQDVLVNAMSIVMKKYPEVKLLLIGGGDYAPALRSLIDNLELSSIVEFVGSIPHDQIFSRMAGASAVVVPSRFEACPYVVIEAMGVGVPVIASAVGGIPELIRDGVDGFLVPPENPDVLAERIMDLLQGGNLQKTMGENARSHFLDEFELKKAVINEADWLEEQINQLTPR